ncbi:MAG: hypothetical protein SFV81_21665 [Pirellulaceae bacterium]|nr:hypothetical protein [Pirellulaceae bacterium]
MIDLNLQIALDQAPAVERPGRSSSLRTLPARGWYLPSTNLTEWMEVLNERLVAASPRRVDYRLYIAPTSVSDIRASGLIYLTSCATPSPKLPEMGWAIDVPLGAIGLVGIRSASDQAEIWLPSNSRLEPALPVSELAELVEGPDPRTYVWLPSIGLTVFEPTDAIDLTQLLRRPSIPERKPVTKLVRTWTALPDVEQLPDRIVEFVFPKPDVFEQMFEQEQDEIGSESNQLSKIDEQGDAGGRGVLGKVQDFLSDQIERWLSKRERRQQQQASQGKAIGKPRKRAAGKSLADKVAQKMSKVLQSKRDQQINKLLKLLQTDPDKALRFAIPLAAMSAFRGLGNSGNRLTERAPDFSLPNLFGSGAVDPWVFDQKTHSQLQAAYRMQAERELAAGRFRRAAYIHAHLLGDLTAAATILERGKAFREAAVIYGDKLKRPRDQARCLALAGQFNDAAKIYEDLGEFEAAAKVWEDSDDEERAVLAYKKAIALKIEQFEILAAAKLMDEKLGDRLGAEELLWEQWPDGRTALSCVELGFRWYAESGKHELAKTRFETLVEQANKYDDLRLAKLSARLVRSYPDRELRELAEDRCRVVAGASLREVSEQEMSERLALIRSLQSDDVLLRRDTARFESTEKARSVPLQPIKPTSGVKLNPLPALRLPELGEYVGGEMLDGDLFALARGGRQLHAIRAALLDDKHLQRTYVPLLEMDLVQFLKVSFHHNHNERTREIFLSFQGVVMDGFVARELHQPMRGRPWNVVHNPLDIPGQYELCGGVGDDGTRWSLSPQFVLHGYSNSNLIARSVQNPLLESFEQSRDFSQTKSCKLTMVGSTPIFAVGEFLFKYSKGQCEFVSDLKHKPNCMAASLPHTAQRIAIATDQTLLVVWLDRADQIETICDDEQFTHVCFMHGGKLLATTDRYLYLYSIYQGAGKSVMRLDRQRLQAQKVVALMTIKAEVAGVLYENGVIERYQVK